MNLNFFCMILCSLGAVYFWIGNRSSKNLKSNEDYFLMGRELGFIPLTFTLLATQLGGGTLLGAAEEGYLRGWNVLFYPLGNTLGFILLGMGVGAKLRKLSIETTAAIYEKVYGSKRLRSIASLFSIITLFFILVAQAVAARKFFSSLGFSSDLFFYGFWALLIVYTLMGGFKAVVNTDILQALFILLALACTFLFVQTSPSVVTNLSTKFVGIKNSVPYVSWVLMPLLFTLIEQDMGQRCFAAKSSKIIMPATMIAGVLLFLGSSVAIYFGMSARAYGITNDGMMSVMVKFVELATNPYVTSLLLAGIFMAVISSADSLLCSVSSNLVYDFFMQKKQEEKQMIFLSKVVTFGVGIASIVVSMFFQSIVYVMIMAYSMSVTALFVSTFMAMIQKRPSIWGAHFSIVTGIGLYLLGNLCGWTFFKEVIALGGSTVAYFIGALISKQRRLLVQNL